MASPSVRPKPSSLLGLNSTYVKMIRIKTKLIIYIIKQFISGSIEDNIIGKNNLQCIFKRTCGGRSDKNVDDNA